MRLSITDFTDYWFYSPIALRPMSKSKLYCTVPYKKDKQNIELRPHIEQISIKRTYCIWRCQDLDTLTVLLVFLDGVGVEEMHCLAVDSPRKRPIMQNVDVISAISPVKLLNTQSSDQLLEAPHLTYVQRH